MSLNDGISEIFVFDIWNTTIKVVINFTKGMLTVYSLSGKILVRKEKISQRELLKMKKQINNYMDGNVMPIRPYSSFKGFRVA